MPFPPVVEDFHQDPANSFLPNKTYNEELFDIPCMIGLTSDEGLMFSVRELNNLCRNLVTFINI